MADTSLFFYRNGEDIIYMLIYVDDIIVAISPTRDTEKLLFQLQQNFVIKDLGDLHFFLCIEVTWHSDRLVLTQQKYIVDLLK